MGRQVAAVASAVPRASHGSSFAGLALFVTLIGCIVCWMMATAPTGTAIIEKSDGSVCEPLNEEMNING